jgi:signal transduction histidine kinase
LRRIQLAAHRLDQLITDSLNYSKALRQELALEPVGLGELLTGLLETYPNLQPDKADIRWDTPLPSVLGNRAALTECFSNLLDNAVKFAKPGVKPQIRVRAESRLDLAMPSSAVSGTPPVSPPATGEAPPSKGEPFEPPPPLPPKSPASVAPPNTACRFVRVWVEDNGIGIPEGSCRRIFGMFQRATADYQGTGIGLAIVRKLVERMGGKVGVESEEGIGSRFWVELALPKGS